MKEPICHANTPRPVPLGTEMKWWLADIVWRRKGQKLAGQVVEIDELSELGDIIEGGVTWENGLRVEIALTYQLLRKN